MENDDRKDLIELGEKLKDSGRIEDLMTIMRILLSERGCPWDRKQTHVTLLKHMKEETEEVADAVKAEDWDNLCEELGDVLMQIAFHCELAREEKRFTLEDVIHGLNSKLVRRHPHVFGNKTGINDPEHVLKQWAEIKKQEKLDKNEK